VGLFEAIVLGIVQGLTEFLPVSSSGHLVLFGALFQIEEPGMVFEVLLHFGTLIAIFIVFWSDVVMLVKSGLRLLTNPTRISKLAAEDEGCRVVVNIIIATVPIVIVGLLFKDWITGLFSSPVFTGVMLMITGTILFISDRVQKGLVNMKSMTFLDGLFIGLGQAFAVLPGISRSGTTIAAGLFRKLDRESAARFSFLLSIPAVLGSQVLAVKDLIAYPATQQSMLYMVIGAAFAALTGYLAIKLLLNFVRKGRLVIFSYYTWFVGLLVLVLGL
jgi:undecaprenyl-diphosphatase